MDPDKWIDQKKTEAYDRTFTSMNKLEIRQLKTKSQDKQYIPQIMCMLNKITAAAVSLTNPNNNTSIFEIT